MSKHTLGPWVYEPETFTIRTANDDSYWLASIDGTIEGEEGLANAHLIAAAPDMLEALELALTACLRNEDCETSLHVRRIRLAIKKAKGDTK